MYNAGVGENPDSDIVIISEPISTQRLAELAAELFGDMVKAVVDINRRLLALGVNFTQMRKHRYWNRVPHKRTCGA